MKTEQLQQWHILPNDKTIARALEKSKINNILDYQKDQLDVALSHCKQFRHGIDVGANYGLMTYNMSKKFNRVSSFEIVPDINTCLKMNVVQFSLNNVSVYDCGLGDKETEVALNFNPQSTFSTHVNKHEIGNIKIKALDSFNFKDIDFIKIDAEGFEPFIINGGLNTIVKYTPVILYERKGHESRYGFKKTSVLDILKNYGYKELEYVGSKNALIGVK
jgi:FkbM family methyltransferase